MSTKIVVAVQMLCISWLSLQQLSAGQTMSKYTHTCMITSPGRLYLSAL